MYQKKKISFVSRLKDKMNRRFGRNTAILNEDSPAYKYHRPPANPTRRVMK